MTSSSQSAQKLTVPDILRTKQSGQKLSVITCYDATFAGLLNTTPIDMLLVGDSAAMVMHGYQDTIPATVNMMTTHTAAVRRGAPDKFIVADIPFLAAHKGLKSLIKTADTLMKAGANALKIEGVDGVEEAIKSLVQAGVPVMGHLGYTPQSTNTFGQKIVQGKTDTAAEKLLQDAEKLDEIGCFSIVLECVPEKLSEKITKQIKIPTIGIGAGAHCDGQVLVLQDMLGLNEGFQPKFLRHYLDGAHLVKQAITAYDADVKNGSFPNKSESYTS